MMDVGLLQDLMGGTEVMNAAVNAFADQSQSDFISQQFTLNENIAKVQSQEAIDQGKVEQTISQQRTGQIGGAQKAAEAASGVDVKTGTPVTMREQTGEIGGLDYVTIGNNAMMKSLGFQIQAQNDNTNAALQKNAGTTKATQQLLGGGEDLFQSQLKAIDYENFPPGQSSPPPYQPPSVQELDSTLSLK